MGSFDDAIEEPRPPNRDELYLAYRQAKIEIFNDRGSIGLLEYARFEQDLEKQIDRLVSFLSKNGGWFDGFPDGQLWIAPKNLRKNNSDDTVEEDQNIIRIGPKTKQDSVGDLDVRALYSLFPAVAIIEVLYLWRFGPALESVLSPNAIGYRLDIRRGTLSSTSRRLFEYWPKRYEEYRLAPINSARRELQSDRPVLLISADLASYYDTVDPSFLISEDFIAELHASGDRSPSAVNIPEYRFATSSLLRLYDQYRRIARRRTGLEWRTGIPIGSLTSRLVANLALATFDTTIESRPGVRCYRRYVDDFVIVAQIGRDDVCHDLGAVLEDYIPRSHDGENSDEFLLDTDILRRPGSEFLVQARKCKVHHIDGSAGIGFLSEIARGYTSLLSERRAFIDSGALLEDEGASLIRLSERVRQVTVLRSADRPKIEHFALSTRLRSLDRLAVLLSNDEARRLALPVMKEMSQYLTGADDWVEDLDISIRLLQLALRTGTWELAKSFNAYLDSCWKDTKRLRDRVGRLFHRDREIRNKNAWVWLRDYLHVRRVEAISSIIRNSTSDEPAWLNSWIVLRTRIVGRRALARNARLLAAADLRRFDREDDAFGRNSLDTRPGDLSFGRDDPRLQERLELVNRFVIRSDAAPWKIAAASLFLATRPPTYFDAARRVLCRVGDRDVRKNTFSDLLELVNAIRGTRYSEPFAEMIDDRTVRYLESGPAQGIQEDPQLILGNLVVKESWYHLAMKGSAALTIKRFRGLRDVVDATRSHARQWRGKSFLILPELALPRRWFRDLAYHVSSQDKFGVLVGLEYRHRRQTVYNEAWSLLPGGWHAATPWVWTKGLPARQEDIDLRKAGLAFPVQRPLPRYARIVMDSPYGRFSVLICSELMEARQVAGLFGRIELLAVPSWNKDTSSYDHLVQSVGLQLHTIVAIANNGDYSDCRVWAPKSVRWQRDQCRLIERGINDVVSVVVPLQSLRDFRDLDERRMPVPFTKVKQKEWRILPPGW